MFSIVSIYIYIISEKTFGMLFPIVSKTVCHWCVIVVSGIYPPIEHIDICHGRQKLQNQITSCTVHLRLLLGPFLSISMVDGFHTN